MELFKDIIPSANKKRFDLYNKANDEGKKKIEQEFWMLQRWMSCPSKYKEHYIVMLNELVNADWSCISKHPELRWKLFALCGVGANMSYKGEWVGTPNAKKKLNSKEEFLAEVFPTIKDDELDLLLSLNTDDELKKFARELGYTDEQLDELFGKRKSGKRKKS